MEVKYLNSAVPPVAFIETPLAEAIRFLDAKHSIRIEVDWESLKAAGITPRTKVTHNLVDGSLRYAIRRLFLENDDVHVISTEKGILITAKETPE